jgi:hypothetical protein
VSARRGSRRGLGFVNFNCREATRTDTATRRRRSGQGSAGPRPLRAPEPLIAALEGVRGYARAGPGCQWAELAWATRDWMWTHSPLAPHHQPPVPVPVPVPVLGERRGGSCAPHADAEQWNDKGSQITCTFFFQRGIYLEIKRGSRLASCTASHYYWLVVLALVELLLRWLSLGRMFIYSNCGRDFILLSNTDRGTGSPLILSCNYSPHFSDLVRSSFKKVW